MTVLLDANVLIALATNGHLHHDAAEAWMGERGNAPFATCPITQGSLVRMLLRSGQSIGTAKDTLQQIMADERHEFWPDEHPYPAVDLKGVIGHRQVTDAYLAHLARSRRGNLATFDKGLALLHKDVVELLPVESPSRD